nr:hypothetical protein [uncultured Pedobacter sp.]
MVKKPVFKLNNPIDNWLAQEILLVQIKKPFLIISSMIYLCNTVTPNHQIKHKILELFVANPNIPIYKMGFLNNWEEELIWKV